MKYSESMKMTRQIKISESDWVDIHAMKRKRGDRSVAETFSHIFLTYKELKEAQGVKPDTS